MCSDHAFVEPSPKSSTAAEVSEGAGHLTHAEKERAAVAVGSCGSCAPDCRKEPCATRSAPFGAPKGEAP